MCADGTITPNNTERSAVQSQRTFYRVQRMAKKFPLHPKHPERICWGCDKYCAADSLNCGNGSGRTLHPAEMLGEDWFMYGDWGIDPNSESEKRSANTL
jgi:hypothetical protein